MMLIVVPSARYEAAFSKPEISKRSNRLPRRGASRKRLQPTVDFYDDSKRLLL
jgi:hypothetical protein